MDKFQDTYREAMEELPRLHMEAGQVRDELHHYRMQKQGRNYLIRKGCAAAAVFLLCGAGTAVAVNICKSRVEVSDNGFIITGRSTQEQSEDEEGILDTASISKSGGVFSIEDDVPEEEIEAVEYEPQTEEYDSLEAFYADADVTAAIPDATLLGEEFTNERVLVLDEGKDVFITLSNEEACFSMTQADNRGYESYSSATAYMGESRNQRNFTNSQGLNYVVFDSVDEGNVVISVHAAISVDGRDLTLSFEGFDQSAIEKTLYSLDLSVYFREE